MVRIFLFVAFKRICIIKSKRTSYEGGSENIVVLLHKNLHVWHALAGQKQLSFFAMPV